ncbi:hypothetical protein DUI87_17165 [Hirundo rustica rustica]|uniref:Uncharacterized protein n=1 Tax=Hirundo rustica rustica TaxID=333673 RepID=A0A3M0K3Q8_HIRRU|nr:hypothetical protein DUI87_17165 [Hirundo rustica rustica]
MGPEARRSKATAIKRMEKAVDDTVLSDRKSMAKKAPAKKKQVIPGLSISRKGVKDAMIWEDEDRMASDLQVKQELITSLYSACA